MKVRELIEKLRELPPDHDVFITMPDDSGQFKPGETAPADLVLVTSEGVVEIFGPDPDPDQDPD